MGAGKGKTRRATARLSRGLGPGISFGQGKARRIRASQITVPTQDGFVIRRTELDAFLTGSAYPHVTYHHTNEESIASLKRNGVLLERIWEGSRVQGLWTTEIRDGYGWGGPYCEVVASCRRLLTCDVDDQGILLTLLEDHADDNESLPFGARFRLALLAAGYDALLLEKAGKNETGQLVFLQPEQIRIVID